MDDLVERAQNYVKVSTSCGNATGRPNNIVTITTELLARIQALETSLAEAEGRVIAEVATWLRHPDRRKLIEVEPAKPGYWTDDEEPEWVPSRSALKRLQNHKDFATALASGEWKK